MTETPQSPPEPVRFDGRLHLLDQTRLPGAVVEHSYDNADDVIEAIRSLRVRGAPAIGIAAAWGLVVEMRGCAASDRSAWLQHCSEAARRLGAARPTAVNLRWAMQRLLEQVMRAPGSVADLQQALEQEAAAVHAEDRAICRGIGEHGVALIEAGSSVLTHCNAGALAVSERGTALAPLYLAQERGVPFQVYADETRPVLQGARLTAWELQRAGIDVTLICDNMAAPLMAAGAIDLVIVGTDRVTANGDVVNKIGTLGLAIVAQHFGVPFYVACPSSTFDAATASGADVPIEERDPSEVSSIAGIEVAPAGVAVRNPAFDVTPAALVSGIITERGIVRAPLGEGLAALLGAT